ncbi:MAG: polysaccharide deacetylase family protein [Planctomycetes bacterium]|nr:polysaccharide deacetylase family protein [Planctomycetota bacterium]
MLSHLSARSPVSKSSCRSTAGSFSRPTSPGCLAARPVSPSLRSAAKAGPAASNMRRKNDPAARRPGERGRDEPEGLTTTTTYRRRGGGANKRTKSGMSMHPGDPLRCGTMKKFITLIVMLFAVHTPAVRAADDIGATRIAKWKDDKACAFVLMFDDSCPTDVKIVVPELEKRRMTGTFYINPGSGQYGANRKAWEETIPGAGFELANHTFTHRGGDTKSDIEQEVVRCNEAIHKTTPTMNWPRLVSYGQPGGIKPERWPSTKGELAAILAKNHLIDRPDFGGRGAMIAFHTSGEMLAHVDKAIQSGAMECIVFHGVGGDWITTPLDVFTGFLDGLATRRQKVWLTRHIPAHQYATERDSAQVKVTRADATTIRLALSSGADPKFYDQPLTLITHVPADWKTCTITQGERTIEAASKDGAVMYDATPGGQVITIRKK